MGGILELFDKELGNIQPSSPIPEDAPPSQPEPTPNATSIPTIITTEPSNNTQNIPNGSALKETTIAEVFAGQTSNMDVDAVNNNTEKPQPSAPKPPTRFSKPKKQPKKQTQAFKQQPEPVSQPQPQQQDPDVVIPIATVHEILSAEEREEQERIRQVNTFSSRSRRFIKRSIQNTKETSRNLGKTILYHTILPHDFVPTVLGLLFITVLLVFVYEWLYLGSMFTLDYTKVKVGIYSSDIGYTNLPSGRKTSLEATFGSLNIGNKLKTSLLSTMDSNDHSMFTWVDMNSQTASVYQISDLKEFIHKNQYAAIVYFGTETSNNFSSYLTASVAATAGNPFPVVLEFLYDESQPMTFLDKIKSLTDDSFDTLQTSFKRSVYDWSVLTSTINANLFIDKTFYINGLVSVFTNTRSSVTEGRSEDIVGLQTASYVIVMMLWITAAVGVNGLYGYYKKNLREMKQLEFGEAGGKKTSASTMVSNTKEELGKVAPMSGEVVGSSRSLRQRSTWAEVFPHLRYVSSTMVLMVLSSILQTLLAWSVPQACLPSGYGGANINSGLIWGFLWLISLTFHFMHIFLITLFGPLLYHLLSGLLLITQLVASSINFPILIQPLFYNIGLGLPFHYAIRGLRTLFFTPTLANIGLQSFQDDAFVIGIWFVAVIFWTWVIVLLKVRKRWFSKHVEKHLGEGSLIFLGVNNGQTFIN